MKRKPHAHRVDPSLVYGKPKPWYLAAGLIGFLAVLVWVTAVLGAAPH